MEKELIMAIVTGIVGLWLGRVEYKMRETDKMLRDIPDREEVIEQIEVRLESVKLLQQEIKEDVREIRRGIEKLSDKIH
jgi:hypothetical protein